MYVPEIDSQHQEMFSLAAELRQALLERDDRIHLEALERCLAAAVATHLADEERLLHAANYPALEWHRRQHQTALSKLAALQHGIEAGDRQSSFDALEALAAWMRDHISIADRMAGAYLRNHWRAAAANG